MKTIKEVLARLIAFSSITPADEGCQEFMMDYLKQLGFTCLPLNQPPVSNFFAYYGESGPLLVFAGHTDVVPIGEEHQWLTNPFQLTEKNGMLYGRGTADMKGSLAAMLLMAERFVNSFPNAYGRLGFLITSGEEGDEFLLGTPYVMQQLAERNITIDYCIVGEPSSTARVGDVIKIGRRGSLSAKLHLQGIQGHVAYPHLAENPIHKLSSALAEFSTIQWDKGNAHFPPTSMQITYLNSGGHASNIIPGELQMHFNFRYSTEQSEHGLKEQVASLFSRHGLHPKIEWRLSGIPFLTSKGLLLNACQQAIREEAGIETELSTSGGTSDGRFIAPYGVEIVELGPVNATIHQVNESVSLADLELLEKIYFSISERLLSGHSS
ncbi:succinyl-diaminopimelate desuccinylase [Legionella sp. km772]|uniref:succinyl-diaminopimelate desuccinylase n=1 Tax=Legionella sp. km772 TaxID=2498111 RepID=UPI000F8F15C4|nr:succinyl-diaminopimelate desuccinylase [Legionella sp. km772]RUR13266.1 succinyl-diaminopimelate desuccinylase [Legionella sp. km772]